MNCMARIDQLAQAALSGDALLLRALAQEWLQENSLLAESLPPESNDRSILVIAAGLVELFAQRRREAAPDWTRGVAGLDQPFFLVRSAERMPRLRRLCETESPLPLRKRNLFAPATYLQFA
jgi:hypothetical protein